MKWFYTFFPANTSGTQILDKYNNRKYIKVLRYILVFCSVPKTLLDLYPVLTMQNKLKSRKSESKESAVILLILCVIRLTWIELNFDDARSAFYLHYINTRNLETSQPTWLHSFGSLKLVSKKKNYPMHLPWQRNGNFTEELPKTMEIINGIYKRKKTFFFTFFKSQTG